ncbi:MAG: hypothetical protein AAGC81_00100 [Pseudomonadota bacterium]
MTRFGRPKSVRAHPTALDIGDEFLLKLNLCTHDLCISRLA